MALTPHDVIREDRADGAIILRARAPLGEVVARTTDWLDHWAAATPDAVFLAERNGDGWREVTYAEAQRIAVGIARVLVARGLGPDTPILIITGNSVAHGLLALGAQYVGVPIVPLAEQYAAIAAANGRLDEAVALTQPAAVFAEVEMPALARESLKGLIHFTAAGLLAEAETSQSDIAAVRAAVGPDSVAKILMTSGSTSAPKGVLTTHRMMCTNQAQIAACLPFLTERPPVLVDWLPWNHVFGGSHNFNMVLANGGSLYIDGGKPIPALLPKMIENNRLKQATISFNVPVGFAALRDAMKDDPGFAKACFQDLDMLFYAGASLPQDVWADLSAMAEAAGAKTLFTSSWGLTETAPAALLQHELTDQSGVIGVPLPGVDVKLIPDADMRCEVRVRGPSIFTTYLNAPDKTAEAFDEEGYFITGDAVRFIDPANANAGLRFDGRLSEDFKLTTGTWVRAANLRLEVLVALKGMVQDVCLVGEGRDEVGLLIVPSPALQGERADGAVQVEAAPIQAAMAGFTGGSAMRIARALVMADPPSMADGEITAKGNLNFAKLQSRRAALVDRLYDDADPATIKIGGT